MYPLESIEGNVATFFFFLADTNFTDSNSGFELPNSVLGGFSFLMKSLVKKLAPL